VRSPRGTGPRVVRLTREGRNVQQVLRRIAHRRQWPTATSSLKTWHGDQWRPALAAFAVGTRPVRLAGGVPTGAAADYVAKVELYTNNPPVGSTAVGGTGGWQTWITMSANLTKVTGVHSVYLTFTSSSGWEVGNINWFTFER
jgi:Carbohydrate binding module (family 6)